MALVHTKLEDRWYFSKEELEKTPSVLSGMDSGKELSYRQQSANLIQDMGQRLAVTQLTINTAIVYMHRFYMFHSFSAINRNIVAPCCLFLSAKLEEQPRKLEYVIKVAHACLHRDEESLDTKSEKYLQQAQELVINESVLLQTLGFDLTVDHPHTHVVRITQLVRASKDLAQTSYFMATNSLHLTSFCIQHKPAVVACVCIHLACKWSNWEFPRSSDNKDWWEYGDPSVTKQLLDSICQEFLNIIETCPSRLKRRINTVTIYKGGHHKGKTAGESSSKGAEGSKGAASSANHGNASASSKDTTQSRSVENNGEKHVEKESKNAEPKKNDTTLTITSSAAVVETATSKVTLPPLPPLTTKYANLPTAAVPTTTKDAKSSSGASRAEHESKLSSAGGKHKYRELEDASSPSAKKLKTLHSSSHGSHMKHSRPSSSSQPRHSNHQSSKPSGSHHSASKVPPKTSSHGHHSGKRPHGHSFSSHSGSKPSSHKHYSGSPLEVKKSSGDRHRRSSSSKQQKPEMPPLPTVGGAPAVHVKNEDAKHEPSKEGFISPPGLQRLPAMAKLPPKLSEQRTIKHVSSAQPPLPSEKRSAPPPPPPPTLPPPPPPPPT